MSNKEKPLTATEIKEGWERNCEVCSSIAAIEARPDPIFGPLIERTLKIIEANNGKA